LRGVFVKNWIVRLLFAGLAVWATLPGAALAQCAKMKPTRPGEVYLLRGLGNIFSLGLDEMGQDYTKFGVENCIFNHSVWESLANDIIERSYRRQVNFPVIIIGHSLGAGAAPRLATRLGKAGIPISYVVMFDPVEPTLVGANVAEVINYYLPKRQDNKVYGSDQFTGTLQNVNLAKFGGFTHLNVDYDKGLRRAIYEKSLALSDAAAAERAAAAAQQSAPPAVVAPPRRTVGR
jgi:thioesterase domain-containing protein